MNDLEKLTKVVKETKFSKIDELTFFIARRGNNAMYPENSRLAFKSVFRHWGIETTVQVSTDGKWYCFNDQTVDRMTNGTGNLMSKTSAQIDALRLDAGNGITGLPDDFKKIPTIDQYLEDCIFARKVPVIEISALKTDYTDAQLDSIVTAIRNKGLVTKVVIISSVLTILQKMRIRMPQTIMHYLVENDSADVFSACIGNDFVPSFSNTGNSLTAAVVNKYHAANLEIGMRGSPTAADQEKMKALGFDYLSVDTPSGFLRYEEPTLLGGFNNNNSASSGPTYIEEVSPGVIHIKLNLKDGNNTVGTSILKLPEWAIPRWTSTVVGSVRATKVASHTFIPASVDIGGYGALLTAEGAKNFGLLTVGTNWDQRATYSSFDVNYTI